MRTVTITWKSNKSDRFWLGTKELLSSGFYARYTIEVTEELFATIGEVSDEIEVPTEALR